jgi:hypothetical protein
VAYSYLEEGARNPSLMTWNTYLEKYIIHYNPTKITQYVQIISYTNLLPYRKKFAITLSTLISLYITQTSLRITSKYPQKH